MEGGILFMAVKKTITITNTSTDELYIDADAIVQAKSNIKKDLANIVNALNSIEQHYKTLRDHKATKGTWLDVAKACVNSSNKYETKMKNDRASLEDAVDDAIQKYVLSQIEDLRSVEAAANSII